MKNTKVNETVILLVINSLCRAALLKSYVYCQSGSFWEPVHDQDIEV